MKLPLHELFHIAQTYTWGQNIRVRARNLFYQGGGGGRRVKMEQPIQKTFGRMNSTAKTVEGPAQPRRLLWGKKKVDKLGHLCVCFGKKKKKCM